MSVKCTVQRCSLVTGTQKKACVCSKLNWREPANVNAMECQV